MERIRTMVFGLLLALAVALVSPAQASQPTPVNEKTSLSTTYTVRLEAYDFGSLVETRELTITADSDTEFRNAVGNAQASFGRSLNDRGKKWNRITYVVVD